MDRPSARACATISQSGGTVFSLPATSESGTATILSSRSATMQPNFPSRMSSAAAAPKRLEKLSYEAQKELNKKLRKLEKQVADCEQIGRAHV